MPRIPVPRPRPRIERMVQQINIWRALGLIAGAATGLVVVESFLMRLVEPDVFTSYGDAVWFSVVTVATVGYGDLVPESGDGRLAASIMILFGMAWIPLVASLVVAALTRVFTRAQQEQHELAMRRIEQRLDELQRLITERDGYGDESSDSNP